MPILCRHILLGACVVSALFPAWGVRAPVSEAFSAWIDEGAPRGGYVPSPVDMSHLPAAYKAFAAKRAAGRRLALRATGGSSLPARWDAREQGWVTPVRNQNPYGTCWAHAALACLETAILKATAGVETNDFSENHLANHDVGFEWTYDDGGNGQMADALFTAWQDPIDEKDDPYTNPGMSVDLPAVCHVQNTVTLPARANATDNDTLKQAVLDYGAVMVSYNASFGSSNYKTGAYYCSSSVEPNHAVTLVGWDDNYSTNNFSKSAIPPGNGAFLIKNSWGENAYGMTNGYSWISYYDKTFVRASESAYAYPAPESASNYGRIYQYDPCGQLATYNVLDSGESESRPYTNWCANVFSSVATGIVEAAGFYSAAPGTEYTLRVYNALVGSTPETGTLVSEQTGTVSVAGFVTVPLATPVPIAAGGERFAVALAVTSPGTDYPILVEQSFAGFAVCTANAGESFYSKDGRNWKDFQLFDKTANVCLKAYTRFGSDGPLSDPLIASVTPTETHLFLRGGEAASFSVEPVASVEDAAVAWLVDGHVAGTERTFIYETTPADHGVHAVVCQVRHEGLVDERTWSVSVATDVRVADDAALVAAIGDAVAGDRILVAPGTYAGQLDGPAVPALILAEEGPEKTFLVRTNGYCCYYGYYNPSAVLAGFTLQGGQCSSGGGAYYGVISNCVITGCLANYGGGACDCTLIDCVIYDNQANYYGGGAYECTLTHCTVFGNYAGYGGGVCFETALTVRDSIVWGNVNGYGYTDNWLDDGKARPTFVNSCTYPDGFIGENAITNDPVLVSLTRPDWRLRVVSPCLNTASDGLNMGAWQGEGVPLHVPTNLYVDAATGCDTNDGLSWVTAFATIQAAVTAAEPKDTITVKPGVYGPVSSPHEVLDIVSTDGASATVIDAAGTNTCFVANGDTLLDGFTLRNGSYAGDGGGAYGGTLVGCVISNCVAYNGGGAASSYVMNSLVVSNRAERQNFRNGGYGGGVYECILDGSTVAGNWAAVCGGGAYLHLFGNACNSLVATNVCAKGSANGHDVYGNAYWTMVNTLSDRDAKFLDAEHGDWHLAANSPAIDAGTNDYVSATNDLDGAARIFGPRVDLGCYEYNHVPAGWTTPFVQPGASPAQEAAAVSAALTGVGFPASVAAHVTTLVDYNKLTAWSEAKGVSVSDHAASLTALLSPALGADALLVLEAEDLNPVSMSIAPSATGATEAKLLLSFEAYEAARCDPSLLNAAVGIVGAATPDPATFSSAGLTTTAAPVQEGVELTVTPPAEATAYFLRPVIR